MMYTYDVYGPLIVYLVILNIEMHNLFHQLKYLNKICLICSISYHDVYAFIL